MGGSVSHCQKGICSFKAGVASEMENGLGGLQKGEVFFDGAFVGPETNCCVV